jgi:D-tyrosyl-tRNA(Tyr) deacylase
MIALIQRVSTGSVRIGADIVGAIDAGIVALIGVVRGDGHSQADRLLQRILDYRVFPDEAGRMNLSLRQTGGGLLLVPQFTLAADTGRGNRASFTPAAAPADAAALFSYLLEQACALHRPVASGQFGAHMQIALINDGPVTFWLETAPDA